jgi:hypothetical protein
MCQEHYRSKSEEIRRRGSEMLIPNFCENRKGKSTDYEDRYLLIGRRT